MILLKATTETLSIVTSSTAAVDFSTSYADITTTTFTPSTYEGKTSTATSTSIVGAPAASTQRQVKLITISNRDAATTVVVTVQKLISGTTYNLTPASTLLPGETMQYMDGTGWIYYSATGAIKGSQTAAGSNTQIQFNNNGTLAGDSDFTWNSSSNILALGTSPQIQLSAYSGTPPIPAAATLEIYSSVISGKMALMKQGPSGDAEALQAALWQNNTVLWTPGVAAGNMQGSSLNTIGTATAVTTPATTNIYTSMRRSTFATTTTAQTEAGVYTDNMFFRGASAGMGGFLFVCRFGLNTWTTGDRLFVGFTSVPTTVLTAQPSTRVNSLGFAIEAADTAITFLHSDAAGTPNYTKETITGQPALATNNGYDAYIFARPNDTTVYYRLDNSNTGVTLVDSSVTTNLPVNTTMLAAVSLMSGGASTTAGAATLGLNRMYIETNR